MPGGGGGGIAVNSSTHDYIYVKKIIAFDKYQSLNCIPNIFFSGAREKKETYRRDLNENKHLYNLKYISYRNT